MQLHTYTHSQTHNHAHAQCIHKHQGTNGRSENVQPSSLGQMGGQSTSQQDNRLFSQPLSGRRSRARPNSSRNFENGGQEHAQTTSQTLVRGRDHEHDKTGATKLRRREVNNTSKQKKNFGKGAVKNMPNQQ